MPYKDEPTLDPDVSCRKCGRVGGVTWQLWESSDEAHEDVRYDCTYCKATWWVDGCDS